MEVVQRRYIERLVGCIENVCNPQCELSGREKRALIKEMITSDNAQKAAAIARPRTRMMKVMIAPIKAQNVGIAYREGRFISFVKRHNTKIFATLKANR